MMDDLFLSAQYEARKIAEAGGTETALNLLGAALEASEALRAMMDRHHIAEEALQGREIEKLQNRVKELENKSPHTTDEEHQKEIKTLSRALQERNDYEKRLIDQIEQLVLEKQDKTRQAETLNEENMQLAQELMQAQAERDGEAEAAETTKARFEELKKTNTALQRRIEELKAENQSLRECL